MKVALYFEFNRFANGYFFKDTANGIKSAYENQKKVLDSMDVDYVEGPEKTADVLQINSPWLRSRWLTRRARKRGQKTLMFANTTLEDSIGVFSFTRYFSRPYHWYLRNTYQKPDALVVPTEYTRDLLARDYGISKEKMHLITNGVDTNKYKTDAAGRARVRATMGLKDSQLLIGLMAILVPRKGVPTFLKTAAKSSHQFAWIGRPMAKSYLKEQRELAPQNTRFIGYVPELDKLAYLSALDVFIFPSHAENEGIAVMEAASIGLPIIVRDLPVYRGWLEHGVNCLVARDDSEFTKHLNTLAADPALRRRLGRAAQEMAAQRDLSLVADKFKQIYSELTFR